MREKIEALCKHGSWLSDSGEFHAVADVLHEFDARIAALEKVPAPSALAPDALQKLDARIAALEKVPAPSAPK